MWPIIYRILIPGTLIVIVSVVLGILELHRYKKNKKKEKKQYKNIIAAVVYLGISIFGAFLTVDGSLDLVLQDFTTHTGTLLKTYRGREIYIYELYFSADSGKQYNDFCYTFSSVVRGNQITEGKIYKFTYAKRTCMLLDIKEE